MKLTVKQAAAEIGETSAVIRNWLRDFKTLIPTEKGENGYNMFTAESMEVLRKIQKLHRDQGFSTKQIEYYLTTGEQIGAAAEVAEIHPGKLDEIHTMLQAIMENQQRNEEMNRRIIQRLDERDKVITEFITAQREQKTLIETSINKPKRKLSLWDRISGNKK